MTNFYKLTEEIKQFILEKKRASPKLSCRQLAPLIKEHFGVNLSKSLINNVIKEGNLSSPRGRTRTRQVEIAQKEPEFKLGKTPGLIVNGGCFFLKAADLRVALTSSLATSLSIYLPRLANLNLTEIIEALVYSPLFKQKNYLWQFLGKGISEETLEAYLHELAQVPLDELNKALKRAGINRNINKYNELHKQCLVSLNAYVQTNFFPSVYQILDLVTMQERFYSLSAQTESKPGVLKIQLFYPPSFPWSNDIVWQEDVAYAAQKVNVAKIFTLQKAQLWISPFPQIQDEKTVSFL
jgi:hypothetical protein